MFTIIWLRPRGLTDFRLQYHRTVNKKIMFYYYNYYHVVDCSNVSTTIDPFWDISLDLGPTEAETGTFLFLVFSLHYFNSTNLFVTICGAGVTFIYFIQVMYF